VVERADGSFAGYGCSVEVKDGRLVVVPDEAVVSEIHFNLRKPHKYEIMFKDGQSAKAGLAETGMHWVEESQL
jgi:hypothetical protein